MNDFQARLELFEELLLCNGNIYLWRCDSDMNILSSNCPHHSVFKNLFLQSNCREDVLSHFQINSLPFLLSDGLNMLWLAETNILENGSRSFYLIGPVLITNTSEHYIREQMHRKHVSVQSQKMFFDILNTIPEVPSNNFSQLGVMFHYVITKERIHVTDILFQTHIDEQSQPETSSFAGRHASYAYELHIAQQIERGNIHYKDSLEKQPPIIGYSTGKLCPDDPLRQAKDEMIVYTTIASRAAIHGGFAAENAYELSDRYIQRIENCNTITDAYAVGAEMFHDYIHKVYTVQHQHNYSPLVNNFIQLLDNNLLKKRPLSKVAAALGYSEYYLTARFKEETGQTVADYLKKQKIEYAKQELLIPGSNIAQVSQTLNFSTPSYFSSVFKKLTGVTPGEYKAQNHVL